MWTINRETVQRIVLTLKKRTLDGKKIFQDPGEDLPNFYLVSFPAGKNSTNTSIV